MRGDLLYFIYLKRLRAEEEKALKLRKERMVSREQKRAAVLHEKLQLLRSITKSHAVIISCVFSTIPLIYLYLHNNNRYSPSIKTTLFLLLLIFPLENEIPSFFNTDYFSLI